MGNVFSKTNLTTAVIALVVVALVFRVDPLYQLATGNKPAGK